MNINEESKAETESAAAEPEIEAAGEAIAADPLKEAQDAAKEAEKKFLYLSAEFENYRKRMQKERSDFLKWGHEDFLRDQLQILDNFQRAVDHARTLNVDKQSPFGQVLLGVEMIAQQFADSLKAQGLVEIKSMGQKLDPLQHEAVSQETNEELEPNTVMKELQKGYQLHGRLLRPAKVVTSKRSDA